MKKNPESENQSQNLFFGNENDIDMFKNFSLAETT